MYVCDMCYYFEAPVRYMATGLICYVFSNDLNSFKYGIFQVLWRAYLVSSLCLVCWWAYPCHLSPPCDQLVVLVAAFAVVAAVVCIYMSSLYLVTSSLLIINVSISQ